MSFYIMLRYLYFYFLRLLLCGYVLTVISETKRRPLFLRVGRKGRDSKSGPDARTQVAKRTRDKGLGQSEKWRPQRSYKSRARKS